MSKDPFIEAFLAACEETSADALVKKQKESARYQALNRRYQHLFKKLRERLVGEDDLLYQLEEVFDERSAMDFSWLYRQAFRDCMTFLRWTGCLGPAKL